MRVIALVKEVPDPDAPVTLDEAGNVVAADVPFLPSTYDENAIEAAVTMKEEVGGQVTVMTLGAPAAEKTLVHAMAVGADEGVLIEEPPWPLDGYGVAEVLAAAVTKLGGFDVILCGREAADTSAGLVGPTIAEILGCPAVTLVARITAQADHLQVERLAEDGYDLMECRPPLLLTVGGQVNRPRYPPVMAMMQARRKGVQRWRLEELGVDRERVGRTQSYVKVLRRYLPPQDSRCHFIEGTTEEEKALALIARLREERAI
ncbi:MAG: electron transfer flavoprotein subunit beta/FixA family protein [Dehalococcoidia bacterium]